MKIILFDGNCNLCDSTVSWIIKNDKKNKFHFASLQSDYGYKFLSGRKLNTSDFDTFILYIPKVGFYTKSTAALKVISDISFIYKILATLMFIIPKFIRDSVYEKISENRYNWFGKKNACMIPSTEVLQRFLN